MWDKFIKQWMAFWWVPRANQKPLPNDEAVDEAVAPIKAEQPIEPVSRPAPERTADDLTVIKGIGPAVQKKLRGLNIITFGDLAEADADALTEKLKGSQPISVAKVRAWTDAAREMSKA